MRRHFMTRHPVDTIIIAEEGQLPQCERCGLMGHQVTTAWHLNSKACSTAAEKRSRMLRSRQQEVEALGSFEVNGESINRVHQFKYLGRILDDADDDEHAASQQLAKARDRWGRVGRVLKSQGADPKTMGHFYQAII